MTKIPLGELEAERLALKERFSGTMRWQYCDTDSHYILLDVVCFPLSMTPLGGNRWGMLYAPSADTSPVPFVRPIEQFLELFRPAGETTTCSGALPKIRQRSDIVEALGPITDPTQGADTLKGNDE